MQKTVFITGSSRGIGFEFAQQYLQNNWRVIASCRNPMDSHPLDELQKQNSNLYRIALDVSDMESIQNCVETIGSVIDKIDLIIHSAGINSKTNPQSQAGEDEKLGEMDFEPSLNLFRVNSIAPVIVTQKLIPFIRHQENSKVIHMSSWLGSISEKKAGGNYMYSASQAALNMMTRILSNDLRPLGIVCASINPGWVRTDMGGKNAHMSVNQSVSQMISTIENLNMSQTGTYLDWNGRIHQW